MWWPSKTRSWKNTKQTIHHFNSKYYFKKYCHIWQIGICLIFSYNNQNILRRIFFKNIIFHLLPIKKTHSAFRVFVRKKTKKGWKHYFIFIFHLNSTKIWFDYNAPHLEYIKKTSAKFCVFDDKNGRWNVVKKRCSSAGTFLALTINKNLVVFRLFLMQKSRD